MADIKGALTRPLGPLPAWGWGVVIGGGYLLYRFLKTGSAFGGSSSSGSTTGTLESSIPGSDYLTGGGGGAGPGGGGTTTTPGTTTDITNPSGALPGRVVNATGAALVDAYYANKPNFPGMTGAQQGGNIRSNPAMTLAQWLNIASTGTYLPNASGPGLSILPGTPRYAIPQQDLDQGLAFAREWAAQNGVTQQQLDAATAELNAQLKAGTYGTANSVNFLNPEWADPYQKDLYSSDLALTGGTRAFTEAEISYINLKGGYTPDVLKSLATDPNFKALGPNPTAAIDHTRNIPTTSPAIPAQTPLNQTQLLLLKPKPLGPVTGPKPVKK
jgi:hypothetical protein